MTNTSRDPSQTDRALRADGRTATARLAHVGIAVPRTADHVAFFRDVLGLAEAPVDDADGARIKAFIAGEALVELLEPAADDSPIGRFITRRGAGIHHLCFAVPDLDEALVRCRVAGIELVDEVPRIGAEGKRIAFLHPKSTGGILIELTDF